MGMKSQEHAGIISRKRGGGKEKLFGEGMRLFWCGSGACGLGETRSENERGSQVIDLSWS